MARFWVGERKTRPRLISRIINLLLERCRWAVSWSLPPDARRMGASPRWIGYVGVDDVDAVADRIVRLDGAVYVPPTNTNIGRISVVADPSDGNARLVTGLKSGASSPAEPDEPGRVGWHELLAVRLEEGICLLQRAFRLAA